MKLLTEEEIEAHRYHTLSGGFQGAAAGLAISALAFKFLPKRYPKFNPKKMTPSIKTAIFITPPTLLMSICAEEASNNFDKMRYQGKTSKDVVEEHARWSNLTLSEKFVEGLSNNKYKIIVASWAAAMYGSWKYVDRDPYMTKTQKAVQARMYAQTLTVVLLLASIGLSMYEEKLHPDQKKLDRARRWDAVMEEAERQDELAGQAGARTNEQRIKGKIFRYD